MASLRGSLTSNDGLNIASSAAAHYHSNVDYSTPSHPYTPTSRSTQQVLAPSRVGSDQGSVQSRSTQLLDYSSGKEGADTPFPISAKCEITVRKKPEPKQFKGVEFVDSGSDSLDAGASVKERQICEQKSGSSKKTLSIPNTGPSSTPGEMSRMNSLNWGASASRPSQNTKKRPLSPCSPPPSVKRHRGGPFLVESDSEGEQGSEDDDDDGFNFDSETAVTPKVANRRKAQTPVGRDNGMLPPSAIMQQQQPAPAMNKQQPASTSTAVSPSGRSLNKNRLHMMMANKPGAGGIRGSSQTVTPPDMRKRPLNGTQVSGIMQKQSPAPVMVREQSDTSQQYESPRAPSSAGSSQASQSEHPHRLKSYIDSTETPRLSLGGAAPSHTQLGRPRKPTVSRPAQKNPTNSRIENTSSSRSSKSSAARIDPTRSSVTANGSSLRNVLDTVEAEPGNTPKAQQHVGSEWRKAQAERVSATSVKSARRPEPGARYGHTLMARKASAQQAPAQTNTPGSTSGKNRQLSAMRSHTQTEKMAIYDTPSPAPRGSNSQTASTPHAVAFAHDANALDQSRAPENARRKMVPQNVRQTPSPSGLQDKPPSSQQAGWYAHQDRSGREGDGKDRQQTALPPNLQVPLQSAAGRNTANETAVTSPSFSSTGDYPSSQISAAHAFVTSERELQGSIMSSLEQVVERDSDKKPVRTQPESFADDMNTSNQVLQQPPAGTERSLEQRSDFTTVSPAAEQMEICQKTPMTHVPNQPDSSSTSVECVGRSEIPVAVMVHPPRAMLPARPSRDQVDTTRHTSAEVFAADDLARPTKAAESSSPKTGEIQGPGQDSLAAAGRSAIVESACNDESLSESNDTTCAEHFASPTVEQLVHKALSDPSKVVATDERDVNPSALIMKAALQAEASNKPEIVNGVYGKAHSPGGPSSQTLKTVVAPAERLVPPPPGVSQAKVTTTIFPLPSLAQSSLTSPAPAMDVLTNSKTSLVAQETSLVTPHPSKSSAEDLILPSSRVSPTSEPYFEYTIHQAIASWSGEVTTEISTQPMTSSHVAFTQMEKLLQNSKQQFEMLGMHLVSTDGQVDGDGLPVHQNTFQNHEDPSKICIVKLWVQRAHVGIYANHTPSTSFAPPTVSKTVYAVRLWKLLTSTDEETSEDDENEDEKDHREDNDADSQEEDETERFYHALPTICTELYTTLSAANRAAKRVQVHMSHVKDPKTLMEKQWQIKDLQDMENKLENLRKEAEEGDGDEDDASSLSEYEHGRRRGCWRSVFHEPIGNVEVGNKVQHFEVLVCKVGLSGPRNL